MVCKHTSVPLPWWAEVLTGSAPVAGAPSAALPWGGRGPGVGSGVTCTMERGALGRFHRSAPQFDLGAPSQHGVHPRTESLLTLSRWRS